MALIYTYPKLTNPKGNELIVVSDVNNRNATRLITLASIASLVPSGGGGCATTYVLKPVICNGNNCTPSESPMQWLFTCKEEFAQFADTGTVVNIKNNNVPVEGNTNSDCWYVETWSPTVTTTTCENCCTSTDVDICIYVPCGPPDENGNGARSESPLPCSNNIPVPVIVEKPLGTGCDEVIYVTHTPTGDACCMQLQGSSTGAPGNATPDVTTAPVSDCNDPQCVEVPDLNREYTKCETDCITTELPATYIVNENLGDLGLMITVTYDDGVGDTQEACYQRNGLVPEPPTVLPNVTAVALQQETCGSAFQLGACPDVVEVYTICPSSAGTGAPEKIYTQVTALPPGDVLVIEINGIEACYTKDEETECNKLTQGITNVSIPPTNDCEDTAYCPEAEIFYQIRGCGQEEWQNVSTDLSEYAPGQAQYVWGKEGACIEVRQGGDGVGGAAPDLQTFDPYEQETPCLCCVNWNVFQYEKCSYDPGVEPLPGCANMLPTAYIQVPDPANPPATVLLSDGANGCCYSLVGDSCEPATEGYVLIDDLTPTNCEDEICLVQDEPKNYVYQKCNGSLSTDCDGMLSPVIVQLLEANADEFAILSAGEASCCYVKVEETEEDPTEGYTKTGTWEGTCTEGFPEECAEDEEFVFQYQKCEGTSCGTNAFVFVNVQGTPAELQPNLILQDSTDPENSRCCYFRVEQVTAPPTVNWEIVNTLDSCDQADLIQAGCAEAVEGDTDGDGTPDAEDAFPNDPNEDTDTDGDGTGNNADNDDDGDGYTDEAETEAGSDPLDSNSTPENVGEEESEEEESEEEESEESEEEESKDSGEK